MDQSNRVTKDISARKTPTKMHSAMEMQAVRASHEAYLNSMIRGYEDQAATAAAEHSHELATLNSAIAAERAQMAQRQEAAVSEAVRRALASSIAQVRQLEAEKKMLQSTLDETLAEFKDSKTTFHLTSERKDRELESLRVSRDREVARLKQQLKVGPNSWVRFVVKHKGRKDKILTERLHSKLSKLVEDSYSSKDFNFTLNGKEIDAASALQEVCGIVSSERTNADMSLDWRQGERSDYCR